MAAEIHRYPHRNKQPESWNKYMDGSDASACIGMHPYKNNVQLWKEKTGLTMRESGLARGNRKCSVQEKNCLCAMFAMDFPEFQVFDQGDHIFFHSEYPWMGALLNAELADQQGRYGILEVRAEKIFSGVRNKEWHNRMPDHIYCHILHDLIVTGFDFAVFKVQIQHDQAGKLHTDVKHYLIERKDVREDMKYLEEGETRFWDCVVSGRRPDLILPAIRERNRKVC